MTKYQKVLNIIGWVFIGIAALTLVTGIVFGGALKEETSLVVNGTDYSSLPWVMYIGSAVSALLYLLLAWLCKRGAKDASKVKPIFVLSLISVVLQVIGLFSEGAAAAATVSTWISLIVAAATLFVAYKVRQGE